MQQQCQKQELEKRKAAEPAAAAGLRSALLLN